MRARAASALPVGRPTEGRFGGSCGVVLPATSALAQTISMSQIHLERVPRVEDIREPEVVRRSRFCSCFPRRKTE